MPFAAGALSSAGNSDANICVLAATLAATEAFFRKFRLSIVPSSLSVQMLEKPNPIATLTATHPRAPHLRRPPRLFLAANAGNRIPQSA
jgi:hypothetical protein